MRTTETSFPRKERKKPERTHLGLTFYGGDEGGGREVAKIRRKSQFSYDPVYWEQEGQREQQKRLQGPLKIYLPEQPDIS